MCKCGPFSFDIVAVFSSLIKVDQVFSYVHTTETSFKNTNLLKQRGNKLCD